jgi:hypothetical protein
MKPYLLMLLLAIPPLISNILACETAEKTDPAPAAEKACPAAAKEIPVPTPTSVAPPTPAPAPAKPAPVHGTGTSTGLKAWFLM